METFETLELPEILLSPQDYTQLLYVTKFRRTLGQIIRKFDNDLAQYDREIRAMGKVRREDGTLTFAKDIAMYTNWQVHALIARGFAAQCLPLQTMVWMASQQMEALSGVGLDDVRRTDAINRARVAWALFVPLWRLLLTHCETYARLVELGFD